MIMETETIDKLFLELSQVTKATTAKELQQEVRINALFDKIAALEADAARMDWIQKNLLCADWEYPQGEKKTQPVICISWPASVGISGNLRSSIDGAMKGGA